MTECKTVNKLVACIMALMMVLAFMPLTAQSVYGEEEGATPAPIEITTYEQLAEIGSDGFYLLANDIELPENYTWQAIGTADEPFAGTFNGNGFTISGLSGTQGLFGVVKGATIGNVIVSGNISARNVDDVGGLVGCVVKSDEPDVITQIINVGNYATVNVSRQNPGSGNCNNVAGIVGHVENGASVAIEGAFNKGDVTGYNYVGGIVGRSEGTLTVTTSYNGGDVYASRSGNGNNPTYSGGICPISCSANNVFNTGRVTTGTTSSSRNLAYAITSGTPGENANYYWLTRSARYGYGNNSAGSSVATAFTNGTVLDGLNGFSEKAVSWISGDKVKAGAQNYPGLEFEIMSVEELKALAISKLKNYVDAEDYGLVQQQILNAAISAGEGAILAAQDDQGIDAALANAEQAINDIPTLDIIAQAEQTLTDYITNKGECDKAQADEIDAIKDTAFKKIEDAVSNQSVLEAFDSAVESIDKIPNSEEVEKADAAKKELREIMVYATSLIGSADYTEDSLAALNKALNKAKDVYEYDDAFEADVNAAIEGLWEALVNLEIGNNGAKSALLRTMIQAQKTDANAYTKSSYTALRDAISSANKLIADPKAAVSALSDANLAILKAQNDLVPKYPNTMTVKANKKTVKYKKVKKSKKTYKLITVKDAKGKVTYAKKSGSKRLTVNTTNGKITVKKGTKKGKYTINVNVNAAGDDNYKATTKTVAVVIIVK